MANVNQSADLAAVSSSTEPAPTALNPSLPAGWQVDYALQAASDIDALARLALPVLAGVDEPEIHALVVRILHLANIASIALCDVGSSRADLHRRLYGLGINERGVQ